MRAHGGTIRRASAIAAAVVATAALAMTGGGARAAFPGDNGKVIFQRYDDPWTVTAAGKGIARVRRIAEDAYNFRYSPNGRMIAFNASDWNFADQVFVMKADGTNARSVTKKVGACISESHPSWSPDGKSLAFVCYRSQGFMEYDVYSIKLDGSGLKRITRDGDVEFPVWAPKGGKIALIAGSEVSTVSAAGGPVKGLNDDPPTITGVWNNIDWSPDGSKLVVEATGNGIYVLDASDGAVIGPSGQGGIATAGMEPAWSPDGERIVYVDMAEDGGDLWTVNPDGTERTRLTSGPAADRTPNWGPKP